MFQNVAVDYSYNTTTSGTAATSAVPSILFIPLLILIVVLIVSQWKIFKKAGKPGWASIVPVYNLWVLFGITGYPSWLALLMVLPFVNFIPGVVSILASFKLAKLFGKSTVFAVMNVLFPVVTMPILAFGKAQYSGTPTTPTTLSDLGGLDSTPGQSSSTPTQTVTAEPVAAAPVLTQPTEPTMSMPQQPFMPAEPVVTPTEPHAEASTPPENASSPTPPTA